MKDRVYIRNLDDELKEVELEEERIIFLPDIEKKLGKIPKSVLVGESHPTTGKEMVLYSVPSSLSIPEEHDKVKKAIIESRARAREKQLQVAEAGVTLGNGMSKTPNGVQNLSHVAGDDIISLEEDPDAMDLG